MDEEQQDIYKEHGKPVTKLCIFVPSIQRALVLVVLVVVAVPAAVVVIAVISQCRVYILSL